MGDFSRGPKGRKNAVGIFSALCDFHDELLNGYSFKNSLRAFSKSIETKEKKTPYFNVKARYPDLIKLVFKHTSEDLNLSHYQLYDALRALEKYKVIKFKVALETGQAEKEFDVLRKYGGDRRAENINCLIKTWNKNSPSLNDNDGLIPPTSLSKKENKGVKHKSEEANNRSLQSAKQIMYWLDIIRDYQTRNTHFLITSNRLKEDFQWDKLPLVDLGLVKLKQKNRNDVERVSKDVDFPKNAEVVKKYEHQAFLEEVLEQGKTPKREGKSIIIGEPGAGKTTLLQQIHRVILDRSWGYPIWISLKELDAINQKNDGKTLLDFIYNKWLGYVLNDSFLTASGKERLEEAQESLEALFRNETKKIWLLLDGLDEMTVTGVQSSFSAIQKQLDNLKELSPYRIILTCRQNLWNSYDNNDLRGFDTFYIQKFNLEQVRQFIENWFSLSDKVKYGYELIQKLENTQNQNLKYLVSNPLLVTMLCIVYEKDYENRDALPKTRAELYYSFIPHYYRWKKEEFEITEDDRKFIEDKVLPKIALWNFENSSSLYLFSENELKKLLRKEFSWSNSDLNSWLKKLENTWLQRVGFTKEDTTQAAYSFFHLTFQEYFAAKGIDDWDFFIPRNHINKPVSNKQYRIFDEKWLEVILFWVGRRNIDPSEKEQFIEALFYFDDGIKSEVYQKYTDGALLISGYCTGEFESKLNYEICKKVFYNLRFRGDKFEAYNKYISPLNRQIGIAVSIELVKDKNIDLGLRRTAVERLERIASGDSTAIEALIEVLKDEEEETNICFISTVEECLGRLAPGNSTAIEAPIQILKDEKTNVQVRLSAAESLGRLAPGNSTAIEALIQILKDEKIDLGLRRTAAWSLGWTAPGNSAAIEALIQILKDEKIGVGLRRTAAESLGRLAPGNSAAIEALIQILKDEKIGVGLRRTAAESLSRLAPGNSTAIEALIQILMDEKTDVDLRTNAAVSLGRLAPGNFTAIEALIQILKDEKIDIYYRKHAAESLAEIDKLTYPNFYDIWYCQKLEKLEKTANNTFLKLNTTEQVYPLRFRSYQLTDETSNEIIVQQIHNQIYKSYRTELDDYLEPTISKITTWSDLDTWLLNLNIQLPQRHLALILENCEPNPNLIDVLEKIGSSVHICCITDKIIKSSVISTISPQSSDLQSAVDNWLIKLNDN